jgi:hypothetical protein
VTAAKGTVTIAVVGTTITMPTRAMAKTKTSIIFKPYQVSNCWSQ